MKGEWMATSLLEASSLLTLLKPSSFSILLSLRIEKKSSIAPVYIRQRVSGRPFAVLTTPHRLIKK